MEGTATRSLRDRARGGLTPQLLSRKRVLTDGFHQPQHLLCGTPYALGATLVSSMPRLAGRPPRLVYAACWLTCTFLLTIIVRFLETRPCRGTIPANRTLLETEHCDRWSAEAFRSQHDFLPSTGVHPVARGPWSSDPCGLAWVRLVGQPPFCLYAAEPGLHGIQPL